MSALSVGYEFVAARLSGLGSPIYCAPMPEGVPLAIVYKHLSGSDVIVVGDSRVFSTALIQVVAASTNFSLADNLYVSIDAALTNPGQSTISGTVYTIVRERDFHFTEPLAQGVRHVVGGLYRLSLWGK